jgi:hypothetical protein
MNEKIGFGHYIVVTTELLLDKRISPNAKLLFGVIANLSNQRGYCFASNEYIAELIEVHAGSVSRYIHELLEFQYLIRFDEITVTGKQRRLYINKTVKDSLTEVLTPPQQNCEDPLNKTVNYNNIRLIVKDEYSKINKGDIAKIEILEFEDDASNEAWKDWLEYRKGQRKSVKGRTKEMQLRLLKSLSPEQRIATINQSITQGWTGLFEVKSYQKQKKNEYSADLLSAITKIGS